MVITRLWGGLGNQMFQYATGRALAQRSGVPLQLDIYDLVDKSPAPDFAHRDCDLGLLMAPLDFASLADLGQALERPVNPLARVALRYRRERKRRNSFKEVDQQFLPELVSARSKHAYLAGHWQDERYFREAREVILKDFTMRGDYASDFAGPISESQSVCLHVRRTDSITHANPLRLLKLCGEDFYRQALDRIAEKHNDFRVFGFSDDVEWCAEHLKLQYPVTWIPESESGEKGGQHFWLMRLCKHYIIPNSTFSWWAAWLGEDPGKMVICPKHWYNDPSRQSEGLLPEDWHLI